MDGMDGMDEMDEVDGVDGMDEVDGVDEVDGWVGWCWWGRASGAGLVVLGRANALESVRCLFAAMSRWAGGRAALSALRRSF